MEWKEELAQLEIDELRAHQVEPVRQLLLQRSILCIFPTAAGKSLIYYLATLILKTIAVVVMPLISLYQDQITKLQKLNLHASKIDDYYEFTTGFVFVTPEMLQQERCRSFFKRFRHRIGMLVIDECHLITEWGGTFRSSYLQLNKAVELLRVPVCALTGSVISTYAAEIIRLLGLENPKVFLSQFNRKNIFYSAAVTSDKFIVLVEILKRFRKLQSENDSVLIYTSTRAESESLSEKLNDAGFYSASYHAGMDMSEREYILTSWSADLTKLVVATTAFALGIDKASVGLVVNYGMPKSIQYFYQESGRAGRNGAQSYSVVLASQEDIYTTRFMVERQNLYEAFHSYQSMLYFVYTEMCRRKGILEYFRSGLPHEKQNNCCDNCCKNWVFSKILPRTTCQNVDEQFSELRSINMARKTLASLANIPEAEESAPQATATAELELQAADEVCTLVAQKLKSSQGVDSQIAMLRKLIIQQAKTQKALDQICAKVHGLVSRDGAIYTINKLMKVIIQESM